jgi:3-phenylpropionate/trans-cinnamate dioxygenase ferredoxin reductase subunit
MAGVRRVVVVGASLAGVRTAQGLRDRGFDGEVVLVGAEDKLSYDRPPLSKALLAGEVPPGEIRLLATDEVTALELELRLGHRAQAVDGQRKLVELDSGESVGYDALVIATGCAPWVPPQWNMLEGVYTLRSSPRPS